MLPVSTGINYVLTVMQWFSYCSLVSRVLNTYVISKFYRILYLSQSRLIFLSNFEIYLLYGDVRC